MSKHKKIRFIIHYVKPTAQLLLIIVTPMETKLVYANRLCEHLATEVYKVPAATYLSDTKAATECICNYYMPANKPLFSSWWRHQMEAFPAILGICAGNSPVTGEFPAQRPVTRSFDGIFDLRLNKRQEIIMRLVIETPSHPLWRQCNVTKRYGQTRVLHTHSCCSIAC